MAQHQRAMAAEKIDVAVAVDIPFVRPGGPIDVDPIGIDVARIVRDAAREQLRGLRASAAEPGVAAR